jgi:hypothetical protein
MELKRKNVIAKDLRTPKYRMRYEVSAKCYDRKTQKDKIKKEINEYRNQHL